MHDITSSVNDYFSKLSVNDTLYKLHNSIFDVSETRINTKSFPRVSGAESDCFCRHITTEHFSPHQRG